MKRTGLEVSKKRTPALGAALLLPVLLLGCTSLGLVTPPDVTLVDMQFSDLTVFETTGQFTLRLTNENADPLAIEGGVFYLYLNGVKVGRGLTSEVMELPALGTSTHTVDLFVNNLALATRIASLLEEPVLDYRIKARLRLRTGYGTRKLTSNYEGRFSWDEGSDRLNLSSPVDSLGAEQDSGPVPPAAGV